VKLRITILTLILASVLVVPNIALSRTISTKDIRNSVLSYYPLILSAYDDVDASLGSLKASQGVFDIRLKQEYLDYSRGFYDGRTAKTTIERQNRTLGSKVYGGYRKSDRDFEDYNGGYNTGSNGEFFAGVSIPLLQSRAIDSNRLGEILARYNFEESKVHLQNIKIQMQRDAIKAYWNWVAMSHIYQVYDDLYNLSLKRDSQLRKRYKRGDVAEIIVVENEKNLLTRKNEMLQAKVNFKNSAIYLSLFYRDEHGKPVILSRDNLPEVNFKNSTEVFSDSELEADIENAKLNRAEMQIIKINKLEQKANLKYAKNLFQPKLDINFEASKDSGSNDATISQSRNKVGATLSLPLQFSQARGKVNEARAKISAIGYQEQIALDNIMTEILQIHNNILNGSKIVENLIKEVALAKKLEKAERRKFSLGASNFFLVNFREQISANSKIKRVVAWQELQNFKADYKAARFYF